MAQAVVDASVVLAILKNESGSDDKLLEQACASTVNLAEVLTKLVQLGFSDTDAAEMLKELSIESIPYTDEHIHLTASISRKTKACGLSLGDRACLAVGISTNLPVLTADKNWVKVDWPMEVKLIR